MSSAGLSRPIKAAVVTLSDKASAGLREDGSGPVLRELLRAMGAEVDEPIVIPDEQRQIETVLVTLADVEGCRPGTHHRRHRSGSARPHAGGHPRGHRPSGSGVRRGHARPLAGGDPARHAQSRGGGDAGQDAHHQHARQPQSLSGALSGDRARARARGTDSAGRGLRVCEPRPRGARRVEPLAPLAYWFVAWSAGSLLFCLAL